MVLKLEDFFKRGPDQVKAWEITTLTGRSFYFEDDSYELDSLPIGVWLTLRGRAVVEIFMTPSPDPKERAKGVMLFKFDKLKEAETLVFNMALIHHIEIMPNTDSVYLKIKEFLTGLVLPGAKSFRVEKGDFDGRVEKY